MLKHFASGVIGALLAITIAAHAGQRTTSHPHALEWDTKPWSAVYRLDVAGYVRVVEWIPEDNPNMRMVFVRGISESGVGSYEVESE